MTTLLEQLNELEGLAEGSVRLHRNSPGFYAGKSETKYNGKKIRVNIEVSQRESVYGGGGPEWYYAIERENGSQIDTGNELYRTKRDAVSALKKALSIGYISTQWGPALDM